MSIAERASSSPALVGELPDRRRASTAGGRSRPGIVLDAAVSRPAIVLDAAPVSPVEPARPETRERVEVSTLGAIGAGASLRSAYAGAITMVPSRHMAVTSSSSAALRLVPPADPPYPGSVALERFETASLELIQSRALLVRTDIKFFGKAERLEQIIPTLSEHYAVIRVESGCAAQYQSIYFDTPDLRCFHDHRRGRRLRHKVRIRHYDDRKLTYLEIKSKKNAKVTDKHRMPLPYGTRELTHAGREFLTQHCDLPVDQLQITLENHFRRISLIGLHTQERVTIDVDLGFRHGDQELSFAGLAVIEIKQHPYNPHSPVMLALEAAGMHERSLSKYTTAMAELAGVRHNRLLPLLRTLHRTMAA